MSHFADNGDLWMIVDANTIPDDFPRELRSAFTSADLSGGPFSFGKAITEINLTKYVRLIMQGQTW